MKLDSKVYDILKWICLIAIPAITVFLTTCLPVWGVNESVQTVILTTIPAVGTLLGSLLAVSSVEFYKH